MYVEIHQVKSFSDTLSHHKIPLPATMPSVLNQEDRLSVEKSETSRFDQTTESTTLRYIPPHKGPEDVAIVASKTGEESTKWIYDFCEY